MECGVIVGWRKLKVRWVGAGMNGVSPNLICLASARALNKNKVRVWGDSCWFNLNYLISDNLQYVRVDGKLCTTSI